MGQPGTKRCNKCGTVSGFNALFCTSCGTPFKVGVANMSGAPPGQATRKPCPNCKAFCDPAATQCSNCGYFFSKPKAPRQQPPNPPMPPTAPPPSSSPGPRGNEGFGQAVASLGIAGAGFAAFICFIGGAGSGGKTLADIAFLLGIGLATIIILLAMVLAVVAFR